MVAPGLPSFGDVVRAIELFKVGYGALKDSRGTKLQYEESIKFLEDFETLMRHLEAYTTNNSAASYSADIGEQVRTIRWSWNKFDDFLASYKSSLGTNSSRSAIANAPRKIQFAIKYAHGEVLKLKASTMIPLHTLTVTLALQLL